MIDGKPHSYYAGRGAGRALHYHAGLMDAWLEKVNVELDKLDAIKKLTQKLIDYWRDSDDEEVKKYYVDAFLSFQHNLNHILKGDKELYEILEGEE